MKILSSSSSAAVAFARSLFVSLLAATAAFAPVASVQAQQPDFAALYGHFDCEAIRGSDGSGAAVINSQVTYNVGDFIVRPPERQRYTPPVLPIDMVFDKLPPRAVADEGTFDGLERYLPLLDNDESDQALDPATLRFVMPPASAEMNGSDTMLTIVGEGRWTLDTEFGDVFFAADTDFTGTPTPLRYVVSDADGLVSNAATITLLDRHPPILFEDRADFVGSVVTVPVLDNDVDTDGADAASVRILQSEFGETTQLQALSNSQGEWLVLADGSISFTPADAFTGDPVDVVYTAADPLGNFAQGIALALLDRAPPQLAPVTGEFFGDRTELDAFGGDAHGENRDDAVVSLLSAAAAVITLPVAGQGTWTVVGDQLAFTPADGFRDTPPPLTFRITDAAGNVSNDTTATLADFAPPAVAPDTVSDAAQGPVDVDVLANDGNNVRRFASTLAFVCGPPGTVPSADHWQTLEVIGEGTWQVGQNGIVSFTPELGFTGSPSTVYYGLADEHGNAAASSVSVSYANGASPPLPPRAPREPVDAAHLIPLLLFLLLDE